MGRWKSDAFTLEYIIFDWWIMWALHVNSFFDISQQIKKQKKKTERKAMIYKRLHRKLNIEQHEHY